jgi:hypothetical protein
MVFTTRVCIVQVSSDYLSQTRKHFIMLTIVCNRYRFELESRKEKEAFLKSLDINWKVVSYWEEPLHWVTKNLGISLLYLPTGQSRRQDEHEGRA